MSITATAQQQFCHLLSAEIQCAEDMRSILKQECSALVKRNTTEIQNITDNKNVLKNKMQRHLVQRDNFLKALSLPTGHAGTEQLIAMLPKGDAHKLWNKLMDLAKELKELNEVNGGVVNLSLHHTESAISILFGQPQEKNTYGRGGQTTKAGAQHMLAKA